MSVTEIESWEPVQRPPELARLIYRSSSDDEWLLARDRNGELRIVHVPNQPSGGQRRQITLQGFLAGPRTAEVSALIKLVGTLIDDAQASQETSWPVT